MLFFQMTNFFNNLFKNKFLIPVILLWLLVITGYCLRTPHYCRAHDMGAHFEYTRYIAQMNKLPHPYAGYETWQPPLYYLINSFIDVPDLKSEVEKDKITHVNYGRGVSVLYGLIELLIIAWILSQVSQNQILQALVLMFICTTPKFIFVFSTYSNDSLTTLLSTAIVVLSYRLYTKWNNSLALALLSVSTLGLYTKYTVLFPIAAVALICLKNLLKLKLPNLVQTRIISILILSLVLLSPYLYFHNYKNTGRLLSTSFNGEMDTTKFDVVQVKNLVGLVLRIPSWQINKVDYTHEWDEPWLHPWWYTVHPSTKRYDYFSVSFVTSVIGEYLFNVPNVMFTWIIFFTHLIAYLIALKFAFKSNISKLSFLMLLIIHLFQIVSIPIFPTLPHRNMEYRYICWTWVCWAVLYINSIEQKSILSNILIKAMFVGIIVQIYLLFTIEVESCFAVS